MLIESRKDAIARGILNGFLFTVFISFSLALCGCQPQKPEAVKTVTIPDGEIDPEIWGKAYPDEYNLWKKTEEPEPRARASTRGFDADRPTYDRLAEYPYMALIFSGWGFGCGIQRAKGARQYGA